MLRVRWECRSRLELHVHLWTDFLELREAWLSLDDVEIQDKSFWGDAFASQKGTKGASLDP